MVHCSKINETEPNCGKTWPNIFFSNRSSTLRHTDHIPTLQLHHTVPVVDLLLPIAADKRQNS